jgi:hypothetical protein
MHIAKLIDYITAKDLFIKAEEEDRKLTFGNTETNYWLHKEKINLDMVLFQAKRFHDSKIFIIADGQNKGFYIYSDSKKACLKFVEETSDITHTVI